MTDSQKLLIGGGLLLLVLSLLYGLWYALAVEHQRLDQIGASLAGSFVQAADGNLDSAHGQLQKYGDARYRYIREVDAHSHWTGLALLLVLLGLAFDQLAFAERVRLWLARVLLVSAAAFPASVLWQNFDHGSAPRVASAIFGAALVASMACIAFGFIRRKPQPSSI
jgi:hypothetical protein